MTVERINLGRVYDRAVPWIFDMDRWPKPNPMYPQPWWYLPALFVGIAVATVVVLTVAIALFD